MADFESTWMSNQHGRNSPEPSVFGAGQEVVINQVVKNPVSNLEVGSLRKPVNFIGSTRGHRSVFFIQGMPRSSYLWALRTPSSCRSSCRFCLRPGMGITLRSSPWFPIQVAMGTQGGERRFCSCSVSRIQLSWYLILTQSHRGNHYSKGSICNRTSSPPCLMTNSLMAPTVWSCQDFKNPKPGSCCPKLGHPNIHWFTLHLG